MQAYEFTSTIADGGIIHVPEHFLDLEKISSPVKIILMVDEESSKESGNHFSAIKLKTKDFKFDRNAANER